MKKIALMNISAALALSATLLAVDPAWAKRTDLESDYEDALRLAAERTEQTTEQTEQAIEAAMREAEEAIASIDVDSMAAQSFLAGEVGNPKEIVKNAPYSAQAVTESTQVLMDGNRIVRRSVTLLARDSMGRTRQEKKTDRGGTAYIYDPIEHKSYVLRTDGKTALTLPQGPANPVPPTPPVPPIPPVPPVAPTPPAAPIPPTAPAPSASERAVVVQPGRIVVRQGQADGRDDVHVEVIRVGRDEGEDSERRVRPIPPMPPMPPLTLHGQPLVLPYAHADRGVTESLGSREFDGVRADGKRTTRTIPAGAIGNEKPIAIVSERWFSPELNVVVMSRTVDPRSGETLYRLTNLKRGEPPADWFRVPADYKVRGHSSSRSR